MMGWYYNLKSLYVRCMGVEIRGLFMKLVRSNFCTYKPQRNKPLLSAKGISSISMPPCSVYQQIPRVHLISVTWLKSYQADPPSISPTDSGFEIVNEKCYPKWHDGDITPPSIDCISSNANENDDDEIFSHEDDEDVESDDELFADIRYI